MTENDTAVKVDYLYKRGIRYSPTHRKRLMKHGKFPQSFKLTGDLKAHHHWWKSEIDAHLIQRGGR